MWKILSFTSAKGFKFTILLDSLQMIKIYAGRFSLEEGQEITLYTRVQVSLSKLIFYFWLETKTVSGHDFFRLK